MRKPLEAAARMPYDNSGEYVFHPRFFLYQSGPFLTLREQLFSDFSTYPETQLRASNAQ